MEHSSSRSHSYIDLSSSDDDEEEFSLAESSESEEDDEQVRRGLIRCRWGEETKNFPGEGNLARKLLKREVKYKMVVTVCSVYLLTRFDLFIF